MARKGLATAVVAAILFLPAGCGREESDERLVDIALRQEAQGARIGRIGGRMGGIERKLRRIRGWARKSVRAEVMEFRDTPQYEELAAAVRDVQEKLNLTERSLARTREGVGQERLRDPGQQLKAMADPQEFTRRLDTLIEAFGPGIKDPIRRQQFEADFQHLKQVNLNNPTHEEFFRWCISDYRHRLNTEQDEGKRHWMERVLSRLTSHPPEGIDPGEVMETMRLNENMLRLWKIVREHGVPGEALTNVGLFDLTGRTYTVP